MSIDVKMEPLVELINAKLNTKVEHASFGRDVYSDSFHVTITKDVTEEQIISLANHLSTGMPFSFKKEIHAVKSMDLIIHWVFRLQERLFKNTKECNEYKRESLKVFIELLKSYN